MTFLIVQTGSTLDALRARRGDFPDWFRRGLGLARDEVDVVHVSAGATLPGAEEYDGVVVTGSGAMVTERLDWSERTADWLREAIEHGVPTLGVCYGHQLIAHALGGRVDWNPKGREIGTVEIVATTAAQTDALLGAAPPRFLAQATHLQSVIELPPGATLLASSSREAHQAVRFGERAWGLQFHPEFGAATIRAYIDSRAAAIDAEGLDAQALRASVTPAPDARHLLRRFRELARQAVLS